MVNLIFLFTLTLVGDMPRWVFTRRGRQKPEG